MKAMTGLSKQQDRDRASASVFCFAGEEQCSVTVAGSPIRKPKLARTR